MSIKKVSKVTSQGQAILPQEGVDGMQGGGVNGVQGQGTAGGQPLLPPTRTLYFTIYVHVDGNISYADDYPLGEIYEVPSQFLRTSSGFQSAIGHARDSIIGESHADMTNKAYSQYDTPGEVM